MESDNEERNSREHEMNKLRSSSASPSALSTASSASPLVRNSSGLSNKRPAATSIAAAQLQRQQLELNNRLVDEAKRAGRKQGRALRSQHHAPAGLPFVAATKSRANPEATHRAPADRKADEAHGKGRLGYGVAKSLAYQAYRFNEVWSINKIKYLNIACLLMTIICLATIITLSGNNNNNNTVGLSSSSIISSPSVGAKQSAPSRFVSSNLQSNGDRVSHRLDNGRDDLSDSLPTSESFVAGSESLAAASSNTNNKPQADQQFDSLDDEIDSAGSSPSHGYPALRRRKAEPAASGGEREHESGTQLPVANSDSSGDQFVAASPFIPPFMGPILSQMLNDADLPGLLKSAKSNDNNNNNNNNNNNKGPIVQKRFTKNGATIVISSGGLNNSSEAISLLDKIMPPFLRSLGLPGLGSGQNGSLASATITMSAEPLMTFSASEPSSRLFAFDGSSAPVPESNSILSMMNSNRSPFGFESPLFGTVRSSVFAPMFAGSQLRPTHSFHHHPASGLLGMIMRASELDSQYDNNNNNNNIPTPSLSVSANSQLKTGSASQSAQQQQQPNSAKQNNTTNTNGSLNSQASQQVNSTATAPATSIENRSTTNATANGIQEPDVELVDVMQMIKSASRKFATPRVRTHHLPGGSMIVFSSAGGSGNGAGPAFEPMPMPMPMPMLLPSFRLPAGPPSPQLMFLGSEGAAEPSPMTHNGALNPILRTILSNVISDLSEAERNKTERLKARVGATSGWPNQPSEPAEQPEESNASIDLWDEQMQASGSRHSKPSHQRAQQRISSIHDDADQSGFSETNDVVSNMQQQLDQAPGNLATVIERQLSEGPSGIVTGTIKQTIRGPGMTVERILEVPPTASMTMGRLQQVASGIKSQSLSRLVESDSNSAPTFEPSVGAEKRRGSSFFTSPGSLFGTMRQMASDRSDSEFVPPHMAFLGRLLSDLGQRGEQQVSARINPFAIMRSRMSQGDDLDEADSNSEMPPHLRTNAVSWPRVHVANARIRIRPMPDSFASSGEPLLSQLPAHFTILENNEDSESNSANHLPDMMANGAPATISVNENKQPASGSAFEETLSSVEDRLNNVLSMVSQEEGPLELSRRQEEQSSSSAGKTVSSTHSERNTDGQLKLAFSQSNPTANQGIARIQRVDNAKLMAQEHVVSSDNPFTSPSSPLFGFPTSSIVSSPAIVSNRPVNSMTDQQNSETNKPIASLARSFQPHPVKVHVLSQSTPAVVSSTQTSPSSMAAVSSSSSSTKNDHHAAENIQERIFASPPAMEIMGRRLDDVPTQEAQDQETGGSHEQDGLTSGRLTSNTGQEALMTVSHTLGSPASLMHVSQTGHSTTGQLPRQHTFLAQ